MLDTPRACRYSYTPTAILSGSLRGGMCVSGVLCPRETIYRGTEFLLTYAQGRGLAGKRVAAFLPSEMDTRRGYRTDPEHHPSACSDVCSRRQTGSMRPQLCFCSAPRAVIRHGGIRPQLSTHCRSSCLAQPRSAAGRRKFYWRPLRDAIQSFLCDEMRAFTHH